MRQTLADILNSYHDSSIFLLHDDLFHFDCFNSINCGITEPTIVSIAAGIARTGKTAIIYSLAGFTLYRAFDQIKFNLCIHPQPGKVIFCNAGGGKCVNAYPEYMGESHRIRDDAELCKLLGIDLIEPNNKAEFKTFLENLLRMQQPLVKFIRLGFDGK